MFTGAVCRQVRDWFRDNGELFNGRVVRSGCCGNFTVEAVLTQYSKPKRIAVGLEQVPTVTGIDASVEFEQVTLAFLPKERKEVIKVAEELQKRAILSKEVYVEDIKQYDSVAEVLKSICSQEQVHNMATAFGIMADYAKKYIEQQEQSGEWEPKIWKKDM